MVRDSEIHLIKPLRQEAGFFTALHSFPAFKGLHKSYEIWVSYFPFSMVPLPPKSPEGRLSPSDVQSAASLDRGTWRN